MMKADTPRKRRRRRRRKELKKEHYVVTIGFFAILAFSVVSTITIMTHLDSALRPKNKMMIHLDQKQEVVSESSAGHSNDTAEMMIEAKDESANASFVPLKDPDESEVVEDQQEDVPRHEPQRGLDCTRYGGPARELANEMVHWKDIPADARYVSPLKSRSEKQYLTFEVDIGGWNNKRLAMETTLALAVAMGRTLVLPPALSIHHWSITETTTRSGKNQTTKFNFNEIYDFETVASQYASVEVITMVEFLEREAMTGKMRDVYGNVTFPPENRTQWEGEEDIMMQLLSWLRRVAHPLEWRPKTCHAAFPSSTDARRVSDLLHVKSQIEGQNISNWKDPHPPVYAWNSVRFSEYSASFSSANYSAFDITRDLVEQQGGQGTQTDETEMLQEYNFSFLTPSYTSTHNFTQQHGLRWNDFVGNPTDVNASILKRMKEFRGGRSALCVYDEELQTAPVIHLADGPYRMLAPFYSMAFFQDWRQDLWVKRLFRDQIRYNDEIQCAAAQVVERVRSRARAYDPLGNPDGLFDTMHIRLSKDFEHQFNTGNVTARSIYSDTKRILRDNSTVYIATDRKDKTFFRPLAAHYHLIFLTDCLDVLHDVNSNLYGMIDQLVASRGRYFFGASFSTFSAYINRLRGYHFSRDKASAGYINGSVPSWPYDQRDEFDFLQVYYPVKPLLWEREFPTGWRQIETGLAEFHSSFNEQVPSLPL